MTKWTVLVSEETPTSKGQILEIFNEYGIDVVGAYEVKESSTDD